MTTRHREIRAVTVLVNPVAGHGAARAAARTAVQRLRSRGVAVTELAGTDAAHSRQLATEAVESGTDALVVVGGDGMLAQVLPAVAGTDVPLGLIPAGTGNDQAREHGVPRKSPAAAADVIAAGNVRTIDLGVARTADGAEHLFGSVLAAGFDSLVSDRANRMRWPHGRMRYNLAMLAEFVNLRPLPFRIVLDGDRVIERPLLLVAVGNTCSYGGGMRICPGADPTDGLFDVTIAAAAPRRTVLAQFPSVYRGTHVARTQIEAVRATTLRIEAVGITAYADGDPLGPLPVDVTVRPAAAQFLVPAVR